MSKYAELLERLEKAEGPDRELDAEIDATLRVGKPNHQAWVKENFPTWRARPDGLCECVHQDGSGGVNWQSDPFTASVDAALALVEQKLPGADWYRSIPNEPGDSIEISVWWRPQPKEDWLWGEAQDNGDTAIAILIALLRALDTQEQDNG